MKKLFIYLIFPLLLGGVYSCQEKEKEACLAPDSIYPGCPGRGVRIDTTRRKPIYVPFNNYTVCHS